MSATSYNEQPSWQRLRDHGKFTSRAKLSREREAFEVTTASLQRERLWRRIRGWAAAVFNCVSSTALVLGMVIAYTPAAV